MRSYLDFEKPVADLQGKVQELRSLGNGGDAVGIGDEVAKLEGKAAQALAEIYAKLTPWQKTQVARHPDRPHCSATTSSSWSRISRRSPATAPSATMQAIVTGLGFFRGRRIAVIGTEKGNDTESRLKHNFGMARPEGYRKAIRVMHLADQFGLPVLSLVDTAGAYPGIDAEARGQAEAIARSTEACLKLGVPERRRHHRRGRLGRRARHRHRQQGDDARALDLHGDLAGRRRLDPLARFQPRAGRRHRHEDHRRRPACASASSTRSSPSRSAGRTASRQSTIAATGDAIADSFASMDNLPPEEVRRQRREKYLAIGRSL